MACVFCHSIMSPVVCREVCITFKVSINTIIKLVDRADKGVSTASLLRSCLACCVAVIAIISITAGAHLMPNAHGPIFSRKEPREKVGVKVRFFLGLSQRTRPIFCRKRLPRKPKSAHTDRFFIGVIVSDNSRRGPIVGWRHSDFLSDWSQRTWTDILS